MEPPPPIDVEPLVDWLIDGAKPAQGPREALALACTRLLECGVRVSRVAVFVRPLHPNVAARAFYWREGSEGVEVSDEGHAFLSTDEHLESPIRRVSVTRQEIHLRLADRVAGMEFPVLDELRADGFTGYIATPLAFMDGTVHVLTLSTKGAGGFSASEIAAIRRIRPALTRIVEVFGLSGKARNLLDAYLGRHAGERVLEGRIQRGDAESIHAVIWFCDLRDSATLAESIGARAFLLTLNDYFECVLAPVFEHGGEVLSFIGDAALAIFPVEQSPADAASRAVKAAGDAMSRMSDLNERRERSQRIPLRFGIGLHVGEVLYGNVGTPTRIAFTVVGPAANEAARIEGLCKTLGASPLVSEPIARLVPLKWKSLGRHSLRGIGQPIELFTL